MTLLTVSDEKRINWIPVGMTIVVSMAEEALPSYFPIDLVMRP